MKKKKILIISSVVLLLAAIITLIVTTITKKETYTITFNTNGGTKVNSQTVKEGNQVLKPKDPTKEGYLFIEWTFNNKTYDFSIDVTSDLTLNAKWKELEENKKYYTVRFNSDGGTTIPNQIVKKGEKIVIPEVPIKKGHTFIGWYLENANFDFETIIEEDIELKANWKKVNNTSSNNNTTQKNNNSTNNTVSNSQSTDTKNEVKLSTPTITGGSTAEAIDGSKIAKNIKINITEGITGVEIYKSTTKDRNYILEKKVLKKDLVNGNEFGIELLKGEHNYYKVRNYVENNYGTFYSEYSNVIEVSNTILTPTITGGSSAESVDGSKLAKNIKLSTTEGITGVEIYKSTTKDGKYILEKKVLKSDIYNENEVGIELLKGEHNYYKVRTFVENGAGKFYSGYSNAIDVDNSLQTPSITKNYGGEGMDGSIGANIKISNIDGITGVEIYKSSTNDGNYTLEKTVLKANIYNENEVGVITKSGEHNYYKIRLYVENIAGKFYSGYSNTIEVDNSN